MRHASTFLAALLLASPAWGSGIRKDDKTASARKVKQVGTLPACNAEAQGDYYAVDDGNSSTDCTTGSGSNYVVCECDGTVYQALTGTGGGTPAGATTQVQFNDAGAFGGDADMVWDKTANELLITSRVGIGGVTSLTAACLSVSADQIYHDSDCDGVKDGGEEFIDQAQPASDADAAQVEDGDDGGTFTAIDTTIRFEDQGDINFTFADGGAGGPDTLTATVRADSVALTTDTTGNYMDDVTGGDGITATHTPAEGSTATIAVDLRTTAFTTGATTTSNSGLEFVDTGNELSMLQGCADGQILKWEEDTDTWDCAADSGGGGGGPKEFVYDAASLYCSENPSTSCAASGSIDGTTVDTLTIDFADGGDEYVNGKFVIPDNFDTSGTVEFSAFVIGATAAAQNVIMGFEHLAVGDVGDMDGSYTNEADPADTLSGTADLITELVWTETSANLVTAGWTAGDVVFFRVWRDGNAGGDTYTGTLQLLSFRIKIPRT